MKSSQLEQLSGLEWRQPAAFSRHYELVSGEMVLGGLRFLKAMGTLAEGWVGEDRWTFKRTGILRVEITGRIAGTETTLVTYHPNWTGTSGQIRLAGETLELKSNFWSSEWVVEGAGGEVLRFHNRGLLHHGATVEMGPGARENVHLALLLAFVWYLLQLFMSDSAATAAVICT